MNSNRANKTAPLALWRMMFGMNVSTIVLMLETNPDPSKRPVSRRRHCQSRFHVVYRKRQELTPRAQEQPPEH